MKNLVLLLLITLLTACGTKNTGTAGTGDLSAFKIFSLESGGEQAKKMDSAGNVLEEGYLLNGKRNGAWIKYHDENHRIKSITHYSNNELNGPYIELNNRGQIESRAGYVNGQLDGLKAVYKFGRATTETEYKNGVINGKHKEYNNSGKIQKEVDFKNGVQDGQLKYYDEEGNVTLEYTYKNGEKIDGGMTK